MRIIAPAVKIRLFVDFLPECIPYTDMEVELPP
jgi:hypothetical protein